MWTLGTYSSDVLLPELWSYFKDKSPLFDVFVEVSEHAKMSCSFSKQAPHGTKTSSIPVKTCLMCIKRCQSEVKELCARASQRVFWVGIPQLATKTAEKKKIPRILLKIRLWSPQSAGKCPSVQLKIPGSVVFPPPPACFWNLKHTIRRNVGGSDTRSTRILLFWPETAVWCWWAPDGQDLFNQTGNVVSEFMPLLFSSDLKFGPVHAPVLVSPLRVPVHPPVTSFTL